MLLTQPTTIKNSLLKPVKIIITGTLLSIVVSTTCAISPVSEAHQQASDGHLHSVLSNHQPKIQMAILLDTSSSMEGLINQTRDQLWRVVNEFSTTTRQGVTPTLEVALFEYGNSGNTVHDGYIRQLNNFTQELDRVSESLFSLTTSGGDEFCGFAIKTAVNNLQWSHANDDIKVIFIAGNEPFTQGPVNYQDAISLAEQQGISVNTIFAGQFQAGIQNGWQSGAMLAGGDYMSINADRQIVHIDAPQDQQIAELNKKLNQTYIPYGSRGTTSLARQTTMDEQSDKVSGGLLAERIKSKISSFYNNSGWDLVDAMRTGKIKEAELTTLEEEQLPAPMKNMSASERKDYIEKQSTARHKIKNEIARLSEAREQYVAQQTPPSEESASMSNALSVTVKKQARKKGFQIKEVK